MALGATNVVAPMLTAAKIVALFFAGMTRQARLRHFLRRLIRKRDDLRLITTAVDVRLAWAMARLAAGNFIFPARDIRECRVRGVRVGLELIFMAVLAGFA